MVEKHADRLRLHRPVLRGLYLLYDHSHFVVALLFVLRLRRAVPGKIQGPEKLHRAVWRRAVLGVPEGDDDVRCFLGSAEADLFFDDRDAALSDEPHDVLLPRRLLSALDRRRQRGDRDCLAADVLRRRPAELHHQRGIRHPFGQIVDRQHRHGHLDADYPVGLAVRLVDAEFSCPASSRFPYRCTNRPASTAPRRSTAFSASRCRC